MGGPTRFTLSIALSGVWDQKRRTGVTLYNMRISKCIVCGIMSGLAAYLCSMKRSAICRGGLNIGAAH
jgi:hypothetical protein